MTLPPAAPPPPPHEAAPSTPSLAWRVGTFVRTHHAVLLLAIAAAMNLWVVLSVRWLPMQDVGGHIEIMDIMARHDDPATIYPEVYNTTSPFTANGLCLVLAQLFGSTLGAFAIAKLLIAFYVVALPFSIRSLAKAVDRPAWLALFSAPMVFNAVFNIGFINFLVAMPMIFWSVALARRFAEDGGWWRGLGLSLLMATTFLAHIIGYMMSVAMVATMLALHLPSTGAWPGRSWVSRLKPLMRLGPVLYSSPLFLYWVYTRIIANEATEAGRTFVGAQDGLGSVFNPLDKRIDGLHEWGLRFLKNNADELALLALLFVWLVLVAIAIRRAPSSTMPTPTAGPTDSAALDGPSPDPSGPPVAGWRLTLRGYALELMTLGCLVGYFVLPNHLREVAIISERAWFVAIFLFVLWPRVPLTKRTLALAGVLLAVGIAYPIAVRKVSKAFDRDVVGTLPQAIADLPDKTRLAYVRTVWELDTTYMGPHWHIPKAVNAVANGGYTDDNFAMRPYYPVDFKTGKTPSPIDGRFWSDPNLFEWDYVLVYQVGEPSQAINSKKLELRWHEGPWWLFTVLRPADWGVEMAGGMGGTTWFEDCGETTLGGIEVSHDGKTVAAVRPLCTRPPAHDGNTFVGPIPIPMPTPEPEANPTPEPNPTPTPEPNPTPTPEPNPTPTPEPNPTPTPEPSVDTRLETAELPRLTEGTWRGRPEASQTKERLACEPGQVVVGLTGRADRMVRALGLRCRDARGREHLRQVVGGPEGQRFDLGCPPGEHIKTLKIRAGWFLDAIGGKCAP